MIDSAGIVYLSERLDDGFYYVIKGEWNNNNYTLSNIFYRGFRIGNSYDFTVARSSNACFEEIDTTFFYLFPNISTFGMFTARKHTLGREGRGEIRKTIHKSVLFPQMNWHIAAICFQGQTLLCEQMEKNVFKIASKRSPARLKCKRNLPLKGFGLLSKGTFTLIFHGREYNNDKTETHHA